MARSDWQYVTGSTNNNNVFFTGIRWRYRDDLFGTSGYPANRIESNKDIIEYQPYVGKKNSGYTSRYYENWLTSNYKYSYNTTSGADPGTAGDQLNVSTTFRFDKASTNTNYYLTTGGLSSTNPMNTNSSNTSRIIQVPHCSDGTSKLRLYFYFAGNSGTSFHYAETNQIITLETIPRRTTISVGDANIGSTTSILINKADPSFTTTIYYKVVGESSWRSAIATKITNQEAYGWTVPTSLYSEIPNSPTIQCLFKADTYSGNTLVGSYETPNPTTFTATGNPIINSISATDINSVTANLTEGTSTSSKMVKYASNVQIVVSATRQNGSYISAITVNGQQATLSGSSSDATRTGTITINGATTNSFVIVVTDSRGYPTSQTKTMTMINYIPLTLNVSVARNTPVDNKIKISYQGNYWSGNYGSQNNSLTVQYRAREVGGSWDSTWTPLSPTISGNTYSQNNYVISSDRYAQNGYDYTKQYEFQFQAIDKINTIPVNGLTIQKGKPIFNWKDNYFNVNGNIYQNETLLSALFLSLASGGTVAGNVNFTGNLQKSGNNVATTNQIPTNNNQLTNGAGYITSSDLPKVGDYANLKLTTRYTSSQSSWTKTAVSFTTSNSSFNTSSSSFFSRGTNGITCNFSGTVMIIKTLTTNTSEELDLYNDSETTEIYNTKGENIYFSYVKTVTSGETINMKYNPKSTSFTVYEGTQMTIIRLK